MQIGRAERIVCETGLTFFKHTNPSFWGRALETQKTMWENIFLFARTLVHTEIVFYSIFLSPEDES